jgi:hypothetical protein
MPWTRRGERADEILEEVTEEPEEPTAGGTSLP